MELPQFSYAVECLAEAAIAMSTAAEAFALAVQAFSTATTELVDLYNSPEHFKNIDMNTPLRTQPDNVQSASSIGPTGDMTTAKPTQGGNRSNTVDNDYYFSDDENDKYIKALLKRQQSPEIYPEAAKETPKSASPTPHPPHPPPPVLSDPQSSDTKTIDIPESAICFERHLLVDLETDVIPTVCALTQRYPRVVCYMQCALPSIMIYHRIIKQITDSTVYAITRPSINQPDNTWNAFNRQEKVILLLPETFSINTPLRAAKDICVMHIGWPSSAQRYRSQLALHDAPCSVLVACTQDKKIFPSSEELVGETAPWPAKDTQILRSEDWIEAHGPKGHRYVSAWDAVTLVNRANLYVCDVLGYNSSNKELSLPRSPPVSHAFVSQNGLESAVDNGVLLLVERVSGLNHPVDLSKDVGPVIRPSSTRVPEETLPQSDENNTIIHTSELPKTAPEKKKIDPTNLGGGQAAVPTKIIPELRTDSTPVRPAASPSDIGINSSETNNLNNEQTSKQPPTKLSEYCVVLEDFHLIPAICMLAKDTSHKNIICYVQIVGVMQTLITQIHALVSKPIFVVASPNSSALPGALKALDSPTGSIIFCNYLLPLCQPLSTKSIHRVIHVGWTGKLDLYSQQTNITGNTQNYIIMTQSQYSGIPNPDTVFGAQQFNMTRKVLEPANFDAIVVKWEKQLSLAAEKALNGCYMEWLAYHGSGQYKVEAWSIIELASQANIFGEKVLRRKGNPSTLAVSEGLVRHLKLQPAVQAGVLRVAKH